MRFSIWLWITPIFFYFWAGTLTDCFTRGTFVRLPIVTVLHDTIDTRRNSHNWFVWFLRSMFFFIRISQNRGLAIKKSWNTSNFFLINSAKIRKSYLRMDVFYSTIAFAMFYNFILFFARKCLFCFCPRSASAEHLRSKIKYRNFQSKRRSFAATLILTIVTLQDGYIFFVIKRQKSNRFKQVKFWSNID